MSPATRQVNSVAIDEQDGQTWVMATGSVSADEPGLWVSNDGGRNWRGAWNGFFSWESVRSTSNALFATDWRSTGGLLVSRDHGRSWSLALPGIANERAFETAVPSRVRPGLLLAARRRVGAARPDSIFRSVDDGMTWSEVPVNGPVSYLVEDASGAFLGAAPAAGGGALLIRSTDQGASWQALPAPFGSSIGGLQGDPARARFFFRAGGVGVTNDAGQTWSTFSGISFVVGLGLNPVTGDFFAANLASGWGSILISEGGTGPLRQAGQAIPATLNALTTDKCGSILLAGGIENSGGGFSLYSSPIPRRP